MTLTIKLGADLKVVLVEGSRRDPFTFSPDEITFTQQPAEPKDGASFVYKWSTNLKHVTGQPNIRLTVGVSGEELGVEYVDVRLHNCELLQLPAIQFEKTEEDK